MPASAISNEVIGVLATAAIAQYQPVQASGAPAVAAGAAIGFATVDAASGVRVPVAVGITAIAVSGAAIALGAAVQVHTTVTQVVTKATGITVGLALTAAGGAGEQIEVLVIPS